MAPPTAARPGRRAFSWEMDPGGVAVLTFDAPDSPVNLLTAEVATELDEALQAISGRETLRALVVRSGKTGTFCTGLDLEEFRALRDGREAARRARRGQEVLARLANFRVPTIAAIHGACMAGGLELALACRYRLATRDRRTVLGFPEVTLGILPSLGGTTRLPAVTGVREALRLLLQGETLSAEEALRAGLLDAVHPESHLLGEAKLLGIRRIRPSRGGHFWNLPLVRALPLGWAEGRAALHAETWPAPVEIVRVVRAGLRRGPKAGLEAEAAALERLWAGPSARALLGLAFGREDARRAAREKSAGAPAVRGAVVAGAGTMGRQVAAALAGAGVRVRLRDTDSARVAEAIGAGRRHYRSLAERGRVSAEEARDASDRLSGGTDDAGTRAADLWIECVTEDPDVKREVLRAAEERLAPGALLATSTSSLRVADLSEGLRRPERFLGMHFFNPLDRMPLVEVVRGPATSDEALARALGLLHRAGKVPVVVRDSPGFLVNRLLGVYLSHAIGILWWGARPEKVDEALEGFGWPVGPFTMIDQVGLETVHRVATILHRSYPERIKKPVMLEGLLKQGRRGRSAGAGIYDYERGRKVARMAPLRRSGWREGDTPPAATIVARTLYPMVDEANRCLEEGIVGSPLQVDMALVMGAGFPSWRGGLLRWADAVGLPEILRSWEGWGAAEGVAYAPSDGMAGRARRGEGYHGD